MRILRWVAGSIVALLLLAVVVTAVAYWRSDNVCDAGTTGPAGSMQAAIRCEYGGPSAVQVASVPKPVPADHEVLVKVHAAAINPLDWHTVRGTPYLMRLGSGLRKPKLTRIGVDFAGTVEAVGAKVTRFKPGDDVFGGRNGALAEYLVVGEDRAVTRKPANLSFEQAAALPIAAVTALQALRDEGKVGTGTRVLINGASGGVGTFAVQIAKTLGAEVTGVCSARNAELVRALGADHVVDYKTQDYTAARQAYDVIVDNVGNRELGENRRALKPDGRYVLIGGGGPDAGNWVGPLRLPLEALVYSGFVSQHMGMMLAELNGPDLAALGELAASGKVRSVIDRTYPLAQASEALEYLETGRARGKVVIAMP